MVPLGRDVTSGTRSRRNFLLQNYFNRPMDCQSAKSLMVMPNLGVTKGIGKQKKFDDFFLLIIKKKVQLVGKIKHTAPSKKKLLHYAPAYRYIMFMT